MIYDLKLKNTNAQRGRTEHNFVCGANVSAASPTSDNKANNIVPKKQIAKYVADVGKLLVSTYRCIFMQLSAFSFIPEAYPIYWNLVEQELRGRLATRNLFPNFWHRTATIYVIYSVNQIK